MLQSIDLSAGYGDIKILEGVNVEVDAGDTVAIIGPNGAGKTTLVKAIMGLNQIFGGKVLFEGKDLTRLQIYERAREGIVLATGEIFPDMSVEENLLLGANLRPSSEISEGLKDAYEIFPRLRERSNQKAGTLSGGERRMLVVGKALVGRPRLLILDEPSAGLAPIATLTLYDTLEKVAQTTTMLLLEQSAQLAFRIANYAYVLEHGRIAMRDEVRALEKDDLFRRKYFGI